MVGNLVDVCHRSLELASVSAQELDKLSVRLIGTSVNGDRMQRSVNKITRDRNASDLRALFDESPL